MFHNLLGGFEGCINVLIQHNEVYLEHLFDDISTKVQTVLDDETYTEVEVKDQKDIKTYVNYYGIELNEPITEFPSFLPYSITVKKINDLIMCYIDDIYAYCKNLFNDETDFVMLYSSIDRLI